MKAAIMATLIFVMTSVGAVAQRDPDDPGIQDSIIVESIEVDYPMRSVTVNVIFVTDDSVIFFYIPITWESENDSIYPSDVIINPPWDEVSIWDSISIDPHFMGIFGSAGIYPINTYGQRSAIFGIHFQISSFLPQTVTIDTTFKPRNGSIVFGLSDGITEITPAVVEGAILYHPHTSTSGSETLAEDISILSNNPNPFNASTTISYSLSEPGHVTLSVYNLLGQKVATLVDGMEQAGEHKVIWDAGDMPSGVYFYRIEAGDSKDFRKCLLLK